MEGSMNASASETAKEAARRLSAPMLNKGFNPIALHTYTDECGSPSYYRIRCKHPDTKEKWIRPMKINGHGYEIGEPKFQNGKPLYTLHRIVKNPKAIIWITEGEQKADALNKLGLVATTSGGATSADTTDWESLRSRAVKIFPDNDDAGKAYAGTVASILLGMDCVVSCVDVDKLELGTGEDVMEWLEAHPGASAEDVQSLPTIEPNYIKGDSNTTDNTIVVQIKCAADITPRPISWLWDGWLASGKFHIFAGQAGTGKTTIAITLAATVSIGGRFPDGTISPVGNVLIWSGEDSAEDTLVPRLLAAGADLSRIHFIGDVKCGDETRSFNPSADISAMLEAAASISDISLLIVDPVVNAVAGDSHKNGEVRKALQPLVDFGEKLGCAVLGISHFSKGTGGKEPLERVTGSLAFGALARIVLATAKIIEDETSKRIFCRAKSNIGVDHGGFEYDLNEKEIDGCEGLFSSYVSWGQKIEGSARELLAENGTDNGASEVDEAEVFLCDLLAGGAMPQKEIEQDYKGAGYSRSTIKKAKKRLGVISKKDGMSGGWFWSLPREKHEEAHEGDEEVQQNSVNPFGENEPLRGNPTAITDSWEC
jgi:hypothetical protein